MIRVLVVDDHTVLRAGLAALLEREHDMTAVGQAATADEAVIKARALQPDVILLDLVMPRKNGFDAIPELREVAPNARVIMLTAQTSASVIRQALNAGAVGFVGKHASDADLVVSDAAALTEPISERERDVLLLLALGYTNQEIATMLFISVRTVDSHRAHIMRKLNFESRAQLVLYALANGLIGPNVRPEDSVRA